MKQLAGMRGLMARRSGEIIETPIISNFKEGLSVLEYFNSTHGARKGLADTALKTANPGSLTRRLVDVAQDSIITTYDCNTTSGIKVRAIIDSGQVVASLASRILGRRTAEDLRDPGGTEVLVPRGTLLGEPEVDRIVQAGIQEVRIRSVLTCEATSGVCAACYGRDLARGTPVNMGEAVGVIAAQSIGEPGTQLTMRTFHIGGAAQISEQSFIESNFEGTIRVKNRSVVRNSSGDLVGMTRNMAIVVVDQDGTERAVHRIQYGARLKVDEADPTRRGRRMARGDPNSRPILTGGKARIGSKVRDEGRARLDRLDRPTGLLTIEPSVEGEEAREYLIPKGKHIHLQDGDVIEKGDYIVEGNPAPHDILAVKGVEELAAYLVNEIQEVYRLQGVHINDKHIEVIVRQMLQKVEISEVGETDLIHGAQIDKTELDEINAKALEEGKKPAHGYPVLLGITKASLQTRSFISAASFQETTRVLTEAAVNGKIDTLDGLKENVSVGRLIPAGTGAVMSQLREVATRRDQLILDEREKDQALKAAEQPVQQLPAAE